MIYDDSDWGAEPFVQSKEPEKENLGHTRFIGTLSNAETSFVEQLVSEFKQSQISVFSRPMGNKNYVTLTSKFECFISWITWMLNKRRKETDYLNTRYAKASYKTRSIEYEEIITDSGTIFLHMSDENN